jgi:hypothetical protein
VAAAGHAAVNKAGDLLRHAHLRHLGSQPRQLWCGQQPTVGQQQLAGTTRHVCRTTKMTQ